MPLETLAEVWRTEEGRDVFAAITAPMKEEVKRQGLWAAHLPPEMGGGGFGQVKLGLMHEILGACGVRAVDLRQQRTRLGQRRADRRRHRRATRQRVAAREVPRAAAVGRDAVVLLDDRAGRRCRPDAAHDARGA